jgi:diacylglycerol kinase (ATP)
MKSTQMNNNFSILQRIKSFGFAINGIVLFFRQEHNAWIHLLATISAIILGIVLQCSKSEFMMITLAIGFVWAAEIFNTAIEKFADFTTKEYNSKIKFIKDVSAAAVLVAAVTALIMGCIIFIPKIF